MPTNLSLEIQNEVVDFKPDMTVRIFNSRGEQIIEQGAYSNVKVEVAGKVYIIYGDGKIEIK